MYIPSRDDPFYTPPLPNFPWESSDIQTMIARDRAKEKARQWSELSSSRQDYSQSGTDIPSYSEGSGSTFAAGSDFPAQGFGYQYQSPSAVAAGPSFDLNKPYIPGKQDYTGIPNATPEMLRRLQQRKIMNPGGQEDLPGFLKPV